jgi:hypothetical protein
MRLINLKSQQLHLYDVNVFDYEMHSEGGLMVLVITNRRISKDLDR